MKTMKGNPITVSGTVLKVGDQALDFTVTGNDLKDVKLSDFKKPYVLLNVVPSLDTSVCDIQTRKINESLADFENVDILTISNDLPFSQRRWCGASGLAITTLSDYKALDFAKKYGVLIEEHRLLARSVFVLDKNRKVIYVEYLDEMSKHPDYYKLIEFINQLA